MKNEELWKPSKFVCTPAGLRASSDPREVGIGSRLMVDILAKHYEPAIRAHASGTLIDLGCGKVPLYETYAALVSEVICVDWPNTLHHNLHTDVECDLNAGIDLPDGLADTILVTDVFEHIAEPELLFREMARVLRSGGNLILAVPFLYWVHEAPHDYYRYTEYALKRFVDRAGLSLDSLEPYGGWPEVFGDILAKRLAHRSRLSSLHRSLVGTFIRSRWGRQLSIETARVIPLGYLLLAAKP